MRMAAAKIRMARRILFFETKSQEDQGAQNAPPVEKGDHFSITHLALGVAFGDGNFGDIETQLDAFVIKIRLELIFVEPGLVHVDSGRVHDGEAVGPETVCSVGDREAG